MMLIFIDTCCLSKVLQHWSAEFRFAPLRFWHFEYAYIFLPYRNFEIQEDVHSAAVSCSNQGETNAGAGEVKLGLTTCTAPAL